MMTFADVYGAEPEALGEAPGRVNLLGEHTDYNEGYVLPAAIPQRTRVELRRSAGGTCDLYSANLDRRARFTLDHPPADPFARYAYGCMRALADDGIDLPPLEMRVASTVPIGAGLSSSAALEIATLRAVRKLLDLDIDDVRVARIAHRAENEYVGVRCGILDQMACSLLEGGGMLFLDTRTLARELIALPPASEIVVIDSGLPRSLAASKYNERRDECERAARMLGVPALRDVTDVVVADALPEPLRRRARHVITENARALRGSRGSTAAGFGALMSASHRSLRDDYEVSTPALDGLVDLLLNHDAVYGAKLTGAGFGGACVALCAASEARRVAREVLARYDTTATRGRALVPPAGV